MSGTARRGFCSQWWWRQWASHRQPRPATGVTIGIITTAFTRGRTKIGAKTPRFAAFGNYRSRIEADDFGRGIKRMIAACTGQAVELKRIPFDLVSRTVQANDAQRNALEQVHSAANDAAETLSAACPKDIPAELGQRLDQLGRALDAIAASLAALRPALATFYDTLDDEQKARLVAIDFSRKSLSKFDQGERRTANGGVPDDARAGSRLSSMGRDPEELAGQAGRKRDLTLGRATCRFA